MYDFLVKKGLTLAFIIGTIITVIFLVIAVNGINGAGLAGVDLTERKADIPSMNFFNFGLWAAIILTLVCFGLLLLFILVDIGKFPKQMGRAILAVVALIVVFVGLTMSSTAESGPLWDKLYNNPDFAFTPGVSKFVSGGLKTTGILTVLAVLIMIGAEIRNSFK
jgi:hypothetical protein